MTRWVAFVSLAWLPAIGTAQPGTNDLDKPRFEPPLRIAGDDPSYPKEARSRCIGGTVELLAAVNREGVVTDVGVETGGHLGLDEAAREAVASWRYEPPRLIETGDPVDVVLPLTLEFTPPCSADHAPLRADEGEEFTSRKRIYAPAPGYPTLARKGRVHGVVSTRPDPPLAT